jgi:FkbM family methyltransferase
MNSAPPITCITFVHNEEGRIADVLRHAVQWADEVLILDKQSTDRTRAVCAEFGGKVRVVEIPFTPQGHDDMVSACRLASHDWIWLGTASEIPTGKLIEAAKQILAERPDLDLVYVPRKVYSFGFYSAESPWAILHYPFLLNRRRAQITNTIHNNFRAADKENTAKIPFADDCCVHHFTHTTARAYVAAMAQYFEAEAQRPDQPEIIEESIDTLDRRPPLRQSAGKEVFGLECAWRIYSLGKALFAWEKLRGLDANQSYRQLRADLLQTEWKAPNVIAVAPGARKPVEIPIDLAKSNPDQRSEDELLIALRGRPISRLIKTLYQVGAHRFQEKNLLFEVFPNLQRVVLFEPLPDLFELLRDQEKNDARVTVLPYAISDRDGETIFHVASNDGASSSLLPFARHHERFPGVQTTRQIPVQTRTLASAISQHSLPQPDCLLLDVQGAEYQIASSLGADLRQQLRLIYTEASTEEIYAGARTLGEMKSLLANDFSFAGFSPLTSDVPTHGNALFVNKSQAWLLFPPEPAVAPTLCESPAPAWSNALRRVLSRKMRRSLRKRLATLNKALG